MKQRVTGGFGVLFVSALVVTHAQWLNYPTPGMPRLPNGSVNLAAKTPRTRDGRPDLSGVWHVPPQSLEDARRVYGPSVDIETVPGDEPTAISKYARDLLQDFKPGEIVMTPEGQSLFDRRTRGEELGLTLRCLPAGIPRGTLLSEVHKIVQTPNLILIMHEHDSMTRQIYLDGRPLPVDPSPSWLGYSVGRWEHDTLIVETIGFTDRSWLDGRGHPRSEAMRLIERFHRPDVGHLEVAMTFNDPRMYNRPFTVRVTYVLSPDSDILEFVCNENEKDRVHLTR